MKYITNKNKITRPVQTSSAGVIFFFIFHYHFYILFLYFLWIIFPLSFLENFIFGNGKGLAW